MLRDGEFRRESGENGLFQLEKRVEHNIVLKLCHFRLTGTVQHSCNDYSQ